MAVSLRRIRVFLSSPGDVAEERAAARTIIETLESDPWVRGQIMVELIAWDDPKSRASMPATLTPQQAIDAGLPRPADCDIVVVILWSHIGTRLNPSSHPPLDHPHPYLTGTLWEFESAMQAARANGSPQVLVYRRDAKPELDADSDDLERDIESYRQVKLFFETFRNPDGTWKQAYSKHKTVDEFQEQLENDLKDILKRILATATPLPTPPASAIYSAPITPSTPITPHAGNLGKRRAVVVQALRRSLAPLLRPLLYLLVAAVLLLGAMVLTDTGFFWATGDWRELGNVDSPINTVAVTNSALFVGTEDGRILTRRQEDWLAMTIEGDAPAAISLLAFSADGSGRGYAATEGDSVSLYALDPATQLWSQVTTFADIPLRVNRLEVDPVQPNTLYLHYFGDDRIMRSDDYGRTWNLLSPENIYAMDVKFVPGIGTVLYAATRNGQIWRSLDRGEQWARLRFDRPFSEVTDITLSSTVTTVYALTDGEGVVRVDVGFPTSHTQPIPPNLGGYFLQEDARRSRIVYAISFEGDMQLLDDRGESAASWQIYTPLDRDDYGFVLSAATEIVTVSEYNLIVATEEGYILAWSPSFWLRFRLN